LEFRRTNLGDTLVFARTYDEGIAQYKRTLFRDPKKIPFPV